jgi:uncharacterized protein
MSIQILMALGPHRFEAKGPSYERFEHSVSGRWESVPLIGREPAQQFMGAGEATATLEGVVYPLAMSGFDALERLEREAGQGRALILVSGYGKVFGKFGVKEMNRTETMAFTAGEPQKIEFTLSLVRIPGAFNGLGALF